MPDDSRISADGLRWLALLVATAAISLGFFHMTAGLLIPLVLAAIAGAIARPMTLWLAAHLGGRMGLASALSLIGLMIVVFVPILGLLTLAVSQASALLAGLEALASQVSDGQLDANIQKPLPKWLPFEGTVEDLLDKVVGSLGTIASSAARFFVTSLSSVTIGAATFFLHMFVFLYALFFFLQMQVPVIAQVLRFSGLSAQTQARLHDRIVSVSRATIKGTLTIAFIQGSMGGLSFAAAGIEGAAFWAVVMMVLAMLPGFGAPFGILCGAVYLGWNGSYGWAAALVGWAGVVSVIDNLLRPTLVGRDAQLHDLMILISTLGGLAMFGASGLVLGPVLAGLFVTIWQTFADALGEATQETRDES